jgi:hypothetical protein
MTVGELRDKLEDLPADLEVAVEVGREFGPETEDQDLIPLKLGDAEVVDWEGGRPYLQLYASTRVPFSIDPDAAADAGVPPTRTMTEAELRERLDRWLRSELDRYCAAGGEPGDEPWAFLGWLMGRPRPPEIDALDPDVVDDRGYDLIEDDARFVRIAVMRGGRERELFNLRTRATPAFLREAERQGRADWDGTCPPSRQFEHTDREGD